MHRHKHTVDGIDIIGQTALEVIGHAHMLQFIHRHIRLNSQKIDGYSQQRKSVKPIAKPWIDSGYMTGQQLRTDQKSKGPDHSDISTQICHMCIRLQNQCSKAQTPYSRRHTAGSHYPVNCIFMAMFKYFPYGKICRKHTACQKIVCKKVFHLCPPLFIHKNRNLLSLSILFFSLFSNP